MNETSSVEINTLKHLAIQNTRNLATDEELEKIDITPIFWKELKDTINAKELLNIQIIGEVIGGKSTVMAKILWKVNTWLNVKMQLKMICADQLEFSRKVMSPKLKHCAIGIDEWNEMSNTGLSSSTEHAFLKYFSDVQAQRFLHRISCSPSTVVDPNATIILNCLGKNTKTKKTRVIVSYRLITETGEQTQIVGHADIYVGDVMEKDWYLRYRKRKFKKMQLVISEGVRDVRELEYSELILKVYQKLQKLATTGLVNRDLVNSYVETERRKDKRFLSILASDDIISKAMGLLRLAKEEQRLVNDLEKLTETINKPKIRPETRKRLKKRIGTLNEVIEQIRNNEKEITDNYKKLIQINKKYQAI